MKICKEVERRRKILEQAEKLNDLRLFVKQKQFHYNFLRLHRSLSFNDRLFSPMEFFFLKRAICL
jgi:hypothetical protein